MSKNTETNRLSRFAKVLVSARRVLSRRVLFGTATAVLSLWPAAAPVHAGLWTAGQPGLPQNTSPAASNQSNAGADIYRGGAGGAVPACATCHGQRGEGDGPRGYPAIGGMQPSYVSGQLHAFQQGTRNNPTMSDVAKGLNDQQIKEIADYVAQLPGPEAADAISVADAGGKDLVETGRLIFQYGIKLSRDEWVPSCRLCHADSGQGTGTHFPPLAGQHAKYVKTQLQAFQSGSRSNDPNGLMTAIASKLSPEQMDAVAAYLAAFANAPQPVWPFRAEGENQ